MKDTASRSRALPLFVLIFFLLFNLLTARFSYHNVDEEVMFASVAAVYERGSLAIDEFASTQEAVVVGGYGPDGHLYSKYPLGNLLFGLPLYALGETIQDGFGAYTTLLLNPFLSAVCLLLLFLYLRSKFRERTAVVTTLLLGLCTDWWTASRGFGSETGAGLFLLACLAAADQGRAGWSAAAFSLSFLFRPVNLAAFPLLALNYLRKGRRAVWYLGIPLLVGLGVLAYNYLRFQDPFSFGYTGESFNRNPLEGFFYLLFSPGRSVFLYSPILLLCIPGALLWWRRERAFALTLCAAALIYALVIGSWHSWDGGIAWAARLLVPLFPLLAVLYAPVIEQIWLRPWLAALTGLLGLLGFCLAVLTLFQDPMVTVLNALARGIPYEETLFTWKHSLLALQIQALQHWQPSMADWPLLRAIFGGY